MAPPALLSEHVVHVPDQGVIQHHMPICDVFEQSFTPKFELFRVSAEALDETGTRYIRDSGG